MSSSSNDLQQLIKNPERLFIGGRWVKPANEGRIEVVNPATEETFLRVAEAREGDIAAAVSAARRAFDTGPWPRMSHQERAVTANREASEALVTHPGVDKITFTGSSGLNNSVFTNDPERAYAAARQLRSGTVGHNMFRSDFGIAFGGFKQSGVGREGGVEGLLPFLESKTVILEGLPKQWK
jgi:acyl-CoA reductase-like NAD-dependent aldehyde dehydrogenase